MVHNLFATRIQIVSIIRSEIFYFIKKSMMYFRPLSNSMIQKLKECYKKQQEEDHEEHCTMEDMSYALAPLYKRGLIEIKKRVVESKTLHCIYVTEAGIKYLNNLNI